VPVGGRGGGGATRESKRGENLVFTFSKERSGKVKGHSVNVILISLSLSLSISPSVSLAFSLLSFCVSSRR